MNPRSIVNLVVAAGCAALLGGCASYYAVRDPATGTTYYTSDIDTPGSAGTVRFKDGRTKRDVTLQNSEVREISRSEYDRGISQPSTVIIR